MTDIEQLTDIFKALADPTRLKLVKMLIECKPAAPASDCVQHQCCGGPLCVNALAERLGVTQSAVSQHMRILRQAGLVRGERKGAFVHYEPAPDFAEKIKASLGDVLGADFLK